tara:strand:+ start:73984 stop:74610 length:627 start_codon:yes stop_codon:yes gene_type:complete
VIEYILDHNPDDRILKKASDLMKEGGIVCIPTDTHWVMLTDAFSKNGVEKLYRLKGEQKNHHFSILCSSISMASEYAVIPDSSFRLINRRIPGHYTFIFEATKKMIKTLKASKTDHEIGLRFIPLPYLNALIEVHGGGLISTNVDERVLGFDFDKDQLYSFQLEESLSAKVDMIIDPGEFNFIGPSTIYNFAHQPPELVREGAGELLF